MSLSRILITFGLFLAVALAIGWHSLDYPMVYDDLHLIRHFSGMEILGAFTGHWDLDRIETAGFRPFTVLFNHARYHAFGENVAAHRVFLVLLYAAFLTILTWLAARVGVSWGAALAAGTLCLCSVWTVFHTVWITDGNHIFQGLLIGLSGVALMWCMETHRTGVFALSIVFLATALLVREDSLAAVPVLALIGLVRAFDLKNSEALRAVVFWTVAAATLTVAFFAYRRVAVPHARPPGTHWPSLTRSIELVLYPMGKRSFDAASSVAIAGWRAGLLGLLLLLVVLTWRRARAGLALPRAWLWAAAVVSGCIPTLTVEREDLYFFASAFASFFVASAVSEVSRTFAWVRSLGLLVLAWGVLGGAYASRELSYNFHPWSCPAIWMNGQFVYGDHQRAQVPFERRREAADRLARLGIRSTAKLMHRLPLLSAEAIAAGHRQPGPDGMLFVPRLPLYL